MLITINYREVELDIKGVYIEGEDQTLSSIGSSACFLIESVFVGVSDIYNMLEYSQEQELIRLCIAKITKHN